MRRGSECGLEVDETVYSVLKRATIELLLFVMFLRLKNSKLDVEDPSLRQSKTYLVYRIQACWDTWYGIR